jgi:hypothetical protein
MKTIIGSSLSALYMFTQHNTTHSRDFHNFISPLLHSCIYTTVVKSSVVYISCFLLTTACQRFYSLRFYSSIDVNLYESISTK